MSFYGRAFRLAQTVAELRRDLVFRFTGHMPGRRLPGDKLRVLVYHGVVDDHPARFNTRFIKAELFAQHLAVLKEHCNLLSFSDLVSGAFSDARLNVLLTFDDGYRNNLTSALPLLRHYGVPAVFFVTARTGTDWLFNDVLDVFASIGPAEVTVRGQKFRRVKKGMHQSYAGPDGVLMQAAFHSLLPRERDAVTSEIFRITPKEKFRRFSEYLDLLDVPDLRAINAETGYTLGGHGATHADLSQLEATQIDKEAEMSRLFLEESVGAEAAAFAFPYGNYNAEVVTSARRSGFQHLFGTEHAGPSSEVVRRLTINPFVSAVNELYYIYCGSHEQI